MSPAWRRNVLVLRALCDAKRRWGFKVRAEAKKWPRSRLSRGARGGYRGHNVAEGEIEMSEKTFQQKFRAFALVAAVVLLIVNLTVAEATVLA